MIHKNMRVHGKVQGVFFRDSTRQKAQELGITGFVQNEADGTVYLEAEGPESAVQEFENWVNHGPEKAEVTHVDVTDGDVQQFVGFVIRRV